MHNKSTTNESRGGHLWKGVAAGLVGGLAASWAMNRFQEVWSRLAEANEESPDNRSSQKASTLEADQREQQADSDALGDTTVRAASAISEGLFQHKLTGARGKGAKGKGSGRCHYTASSQRGRVVRRATANSPLSHRRGWAVPFGYLLASRGRGHAIARLRKDLRVSVSRPTFTLSLSHLVYGLTAEPAGRGHKQALSKKRLRAEFSANF